MRLSLVLLFATLTLLAGCAALDHGNAGYSAPPLDQKAVVDSKDIFVVIRNLKLDDSHLLVPEQCWDVTTANDTLCRAARAQTVAVLSMATETLCLEHRRSIYGRDATANIALGTLTNLFAGSAAVVTGGNAQAILGALALFSNSERSLVNETIYKTMIVTAVDDKIVESMKTQAAQIRTDLDQPIEKYGMAQAITAVVHLHASCSFMEGLRLALSEGTRTSTASKVLTLRQTLETVRGDVARQCAPAVPPADPAGSAAQQCTLAQARFQAVSDRLSALEVTLE
jgi:hypothetical protein